MLRKDLFVLTKKNKKRRSKYVVARVTEDEYREIKRRYGKNITRAVRVALGFDE